MFNSPALSLAILDDKYETNKWVPFAAALGFHIFLVIWDPTILKASSYVMSTPVINVKMMDHLPVIEQPKPVERKIEKKRVHKAKKSGLSPSAHARLIPVMRHHVMPKPAAHIPFVSKITMPKFVPHQPDEPIAASPIPHSAPAASHRVVNSMSPRIKLTGKTRGVRAQDIPFQLAERGGISAGDTVVAIPVGEERGEIASLPSAPMIHDAPKGRVGKPGYRFEPGQGSGDLAGRDKSGKIGSHGIIKADTYVEGSLSVMANGKGKVVAGKGFEIGGPVGERHIS